MTPEEAIHKFVISEDDAGTRIDRFLASVLSNHSRSHIQKLIKQGRVLAGKKTVKSSYILNEDDEVEISLPFLEVRIPEPEPIPLDVVYEDPHIIIVNKPPGMVVHPGAGNYSGTLVHALLYHCKTLSGMGGLLRPGIVHRLDKGTSGLLVAAKTDQAHLSLVSQLAERRITRIYLALVYGEVKDRQGKIDLPIGRDPRHREKMAVNHKSGKPAVTHYEILKRGPGVTLVRVNLETGRTHQIRVHMQYLGHPLIGDTDYGERKLRIPDGLNREELFLFRKFKKINHSLLHAERLELQHPITCEKKAFEVPPPADFVEILNYI